MQQVLETLTVRTFKSLEDVTVDLGLVNVFIGANGSGKSNLLEALGVLSAASDGKVDDQSLLARGVRPGLPALYKTAFPARPGNKIPPHLYFGARKTRERITKFPCTIRLMIRRRPGNSRQSGGKVTALRILVVLPHKPKKPIPNGDWLH